tara:strand:+ start:485 stop:784 length:300 start_codon:yes stop_codon:yes gene_type:complete
MAWDTFDKDRMKQIALQLAGNYKENDKKSGELIPSVLIKGVGDIWCPHVTQKRVVRIPRGTKAYILSDEMDEFGRIAIYSVLGEMVAIDPDEIVEVGFN